MLALSFAIWLATGALACSPAETASLKKRFAGGIPWSALGVVADGTTDNTAKLNALPTGQPIIGDCGKGGVVRFDGQWLWRSNLLLWQLPGCKLRSYVSLTKPTGAITQADMTIPISKVAIYGLNIEKPALTYLGRMVVLYVNDLTLCNFEIANANGALHLRGSNQEIAYGVVRNAASDRGGGRVGIRHYGNLPKVPTTPGRPANVWIHHNDMQSGDGTYQISLTNQGPAANVGADDYLFEDNIGAALDGPFILVGQSDRIGKSYSASITNAIFRRMRGTGVRTCLSLGNSDNPGGDISDVLFEDVVFDCSTNSTNNASANVATDRKSRVRRITLRRVSIMGSYLRGLQISGNVEDVIFEKGHIGAPRRENGAMVVLRGGSRTSIVDSIIEAKGTGIVVGDQASAVRQPRILRNVITGVSDQGHGILLQGAEDALVTGNTIKAQPGTTSAIGIEMIAPNARTVGVRNAIVNGNDVGSMRSNLGNVVPGDRPN